MGLRRFFAEKTVNRLVCGRVGWMVPTQRGGSCRYKPERVLQIGPDLACLEWLMRCGAVSVRLSDGQTLTSQRQARSYLQELGLDKQSPPDPELLKQFNSPRERLQAIVSDYAYSKRWAHVPSVHIKEVDASDAALWASSTSQSAGP